MNIGDTFYLVHQQNNAFSREKIYREIDGETWFRYTAPLRKFEIVAYTIIGKVIPVCEGELVGESDLLENGIEYHCSDSKMRFHILYKYELKDAFPTYEEALEKYNSLVEEVKQC